MMEKFNLWREKRAYAKYAKLNIKRKAKESQMKVYEWADSIRRRIGYVK